MVIPALVFVVGLVVLTVAADRFVDGAAQLSFALRVSPVVVGAVVIGFGTSAPELGVSALAAAQDSLDIAVGNIIGSNVANLTLVLGSAALLRPIVVRSPALRRETPLSTLAVIAFAVLVQDRLGLVEGSILLAGLAVATVIIVTGARDPADVLGVETADFTAPEQAPLGRAVLRTVLGLIGTLLGAQAIVWGVREIAHTLGIAEGFVGFTLVAIGTSLPELVTSVQAARRDEPDLIVGNLLGSNLLNSLAVGGFVGVIGPDLLADPSLTGLPVVLMVGVALAAALMMGTRRRVDRWEGALLLLAYAVALPFLPR